MKNKILETFNKLLGTFSTDNEINIIYELIIKYDINDIDVDKYTNYMDIFFNEFIELGITGFMDFIQYTKSWYNYHADDEIISEHVYIFDGVYKIISPGFFDDHKHSTDLYALINFVNELLKNKSDSINTIEQKMNIQNVEQKKTHNMLICLR